MYLIQLQRCPEISFHSFYPRDRDAHWTSFLLTFLTVEILFHVSMQLCPTMWKVVCRQQRHAQRLKMIVNAGSRDVREQIYEQQWMCMYNSLSRSSHPSLLYCSSPLITPLIPSLIPYNSVSSSLTKWLNSANSIKRWVDPRKSVPGV